MGARSRLAIPVAAAAIGALLLILLPASPTAAPRADPGRGPAVVYARYRDGLSTIGTMNGDGTGKRRLTSAQPSFQGQPAYSPDGSRIAFICGNFELCVMNADGSGLGRLTTSRWPDHWEYVDHPSWSPDGTRIAFSSNADGKFRVYVINADGSGLQRLPGTGWNDDDPAWSPDGTSIAFDRYENWSTGDTAIHVMRADRTHWHRITPFWADDSAPSWSPDGRYIVAYGYPDEDYAHLFRWTASGRGEKQLTSGYCEEWDPAYAPDGSTLGLERSCDGRLGVSVCRGGCGLARLTAPRLGFDRYPSFQPNGSGGSRAAPIGPPSTPTGDAVLMSTWFYWDTQVEFVDYLPDSRVGMELRIRADDLRALSALRATRPETARGRTLRRSAIGAFSLDARGAACYLRYFRLAGHGHPGAADRFDQCGEAFREMASDAFGRTADLTTLPY